MNKATVIKKEAKDINFNGGKNSLTAETLKVLFKAGRAGLNPLRKKILEKISASGSIIVTDIYDGLKIEQAVCSQHLSILRESKLVRTKREGRKIIYSINLDTAARMREAARLLMDTAN